METINELKEKIHFYKLTIQDMKEHYGEFEMETNQEIKELQQRIDKAIELCENYFMDFQVDYLGKKTKRYATIDAGKIIEILKGEKNDD